MDRPVIHTLMAIVRMMYTSPDRIASRDMGRTHANTLAARHPPYQRPGAVTRRWRAVPSEDVIIVAVLSIISCPEPHIWQELV